MDVTILKFLDHSGVSFQVEAPGQATWPRQAASPR
jgi:hypothetical protein